MGKVRALYVIGCKDDQRHMCIASNYCFEVVGNWHDVLASIGAIHLMVSTVNYWVFHLWPINQPHLKLS